MTGSNSHWLFALLKKKKQKFKHENQPQAFSLRWNAYAIVPKNLALQWLALR